MATYDNLPVYKASYDLLIETFAITKIFTKEYKYSLGDKIKTEILEIIAYIYKANSSFDDRLLNIRQAREKIEVFRLYMRLSKDLKLINLNKFVDINTKIEIISKQLYSWENSFSKK